MDLLVGTGGTPEGVLRCLCAALHRRRNAGPPLSHAMTKERQAALEGGYDMERILTTSRTWFPATSSLPRPVSPTEPRSWEFGSDRTR